jgi:hypothetical protein
MSGSDLERNQGLTNETSDLAALFLGALKLFDEFAVATADQTDAAPVGATAGSEDDLLLWAALGLLSLRRTAWRWAGDAARDNLSTLSERPAAASPQTSLLR